MLQKSFFILFLFCTVCLNAQQTAIKGTVTDCRTDEPLPGVAIKISGTTRGATTDISGAYTIQASSGDVLEFSYVGYLSEKIPVETNKDINLCMVLDIIGLEEVVVIGYGVTRKEASTGSVGVVKENEIGKVNVTSPEKILQGRIAGVQINNYSGQPGGGTEIYIRGISSLNSSNQPLFVVDGVPVISGSFGYSTTNSNILSTLDPSDIESISVLKDASAASVYGSRAANGVVLITTKSGIKGKTTIEASIRKGSSTLAKSGDYRFMTSEELLTYHRDAVVNAGFNPDDRFDPPHYYPKTLLDLPQTDWFKEVFRTGQIWNVDLSASGGDDNTQFFVSGGYYSEEGIMIGSDMKRYNLTLNLDQKLKKNISIGVKAKGSYSDISDLPQELYWASPIYGAQNMLPWQNVTDADGNINWNVPSNFNYNPVGIARVNEQWDKFYRMLSSVYFHWEIFKGLTFKTNNSLDYLDSQGKNYYSPVMPDGADVNGAIWSGISKNSSMQTSNILEYSREFVTAGRFNFLAGQEAQLTSYSLYDLNATGMGTKIHQVSNTTKERKDIGQSLRETSLISFFGILNYNFKDKYILSASLRGDGCSRFSPSNQWGVFYSAGASWNMHNESFLKAADFLNYLKLRLSYGTNGNYNIGDYNFYGTYTTSEYNNNQSSLPNRLQNDDLTWEKNHEINAGIESIMFNRFNLNIEFYRRITSDMLLWVQLPSSTGFYSQLRNTGKLSNMGIELSAGYDIISKRDLKLNAAFNLTRNITELLDLGGEQEILDGWNRIHRLNEAFSQWYVYDWAGVNPLTGMGMWYDENGEFTEKYENARRVTKGQIEPKYVGGVSLNLSWKGLSISSMMEFKTGHYVYIMESTYTKSDGWYIGHNQVASQMDYWKNPGDKASVPKPIANNTSNSNAWKSSRWIEKGDYFRLKNVVVNYSMPLKWISHLKLKTLDISMEANNIYAWHDVSYWDPERSYNGNTYSTYPLSRQLIFGIKIGI
ncbi:MAG: TonB-dependent receptor [Bacteroidales bacterium]|nr:TonB-dependent receptor [Bacteroidales bacterium]